MLTRIRMFFAFTVFAFVALSPDSAWAQRRPRVLIVSAEKTGYLQTGGLGFAVDGLANALQAAGIETDVAIPGYESLNTDKKTKESLKPLQKDVAVELDRRDGKYNKTSNFELRATDRTPTRARTITFDHKPTNGQRQYFANVSPDGKKFYGPSDIEGEAFGAFDKAAAKFAESGDYDIVIINDWHTGPVASFIKQDAKATGKKAPKVIAAIHNMAYQGVFPKSMVDYLGLDWENFRADTGFEFNDRLSFFKALLNSSDMVYTVSPNYAEEIGTERYGEKLDGVIRRLVHEYKMTGILNGIQSEDWDPSRKYADVISHTFTPDDLSGKAAGKKLLQEHYKLPVNEKIPVITLTSRLAEQKGYEYIPGALEDLAAHRNVQIVIIGDGDEKYAGKLRELASRFPDKVRYEKFSSSAEKRLTAYSDFFLNGAWFEPSGLNQFFAMKNGTIPIVTDVGGLRNSVKEGVTGFLSPVATSGNYTHIDNTRSNLIATLHRALDTFERDPAKILDMRRAGMLQDNSWAMRVEQFRRLFNYVLRDGPAKLSKGLRGKSAKPGLSPEDLIRMLYESTRPPCHEIFKETAA